MRLRGKAALFVPGALLLLVVTALTASAQTVRFVQFTDVHLFDSGKHRTTEAGFADYLDNRSSLEWAVQLTNNLASSSECTDFVVFTGDFGLEESDPDAAAEDIAVIFRALRPKKIFLLPGNNDLKNEDPSDIGRFRTFTNRLAALVPDHEITDLSSTNSTINSIQVVGLNSASFKNDNGKLLQPNKAKQLQEMRRVENAVRGDRPSIIFTHIPNLEDPYRGDNGEVRRAWNLAPEVMAVWKTIIENEHVLAVFAGHFHDGRRGIYMHDFSWASKKPSFIEGSKTWVAPPLAVKFQWEVNPQARGLLEASVTSAGSIRASPKWFGYTLNDVVPDKEAALLQAQAEANHGYWKRSLDFYTQALASSDARIHTEAERGYLTTRENLHAEHVRKRILWAIGVFSGLLIASWPLYRFVNWRAQVNRREKKFVIETSSSSGTNTPVEFFVASLQTAAQEIQDLYRVEGQRSNLVIGQSGAGLPFSFLGGAGNALNQIADALPDVRGVKVGKILSALPTLFRFLVIWRVECGISVHEDGSGWAHATLRWRRTTVQTWVEAVKVSVEDSPEESLQSAVVRVLAWRIASDILSRDLVTQAL
jgi:predicted MPP superfamily phosphohydrolase